MSHMTSYEFGNDGCLTLPFPAFKQHGTYIFDVVQFGNLRVEDSSDIKSITIRIFGDGVEVFDAHIRVAHGDTRVVGFDASLKKQGGDTVVFMNKNVQGLGQEGECPICIETNIDDIYPIQQYDCGHGVCTQCISDLHHHRLKSEPQALFMICPVCRKPLQATGANSENMYARFFEVRKQKGTRTISFFESLWDSYAYMFNSFL